MALRALNRDLAAIAALFRDGQLVSEFVGAIPEQAIRQWLEPLLPSEADRIAEEGQRAEQAGKTDKAERLFRENRARGATAFRVKDGEPGERIEEFDPTDKQIIMVPRIAGG